MLNLISIIFGLQDLPVDFERFGMNLLVARRQLRDFSLGHGALAGVSDSLVVGVEEGDDVVDLADDLTLPHKQRVGPSLALLDDNRRLLRETKILRTHTLVTLLERVRVHVLIAHL